MKTVILSLTILLMMVSCVEDNDHDAIARTFDPNLEGKVEITFKELFDLHNRTIGKDTIVTGYVVSTDDERNFYREIYVQNTLSTDNLARDNPRMGLRVRLGLRSTSAKYALGRKVAINLEGLKKTTTNNILTVGAVKDNFIKDIVEFEVDKHVLKLDEVQEIMPKSIQISALTEQEFNTLISISHVQFKEIELGKTLANMPSDRFDGERTLEFCNTFTKDTIVLETSNFANFASEIILRNQLKVTGIYTLSFDDVPVLILNRFNDLQSVGTYEDCNPLTPDVFITEVADPEESSKSRFVELYNQTEEAINLSGWSLLRYNYTASNNTKEKAALKIPLKNLVVKSKGFVVIARDNVTFKDYFNIEPNLVSSKLDGNGDDAYELMDASGKVIDVFGNSNIDGSDTEWDYTDGIAKRNIDVVKGGSVFKLSEWEIMRNVKERLRYTPYER
ncbi:DUF5689 domain-containing protein [Wenyingzhuangia sp. IMCC45533]